MRLLTALAFGVLLSCVGVASSEEPAAVETRLDAVANANPQEIDGWPSFRRDPQQQGVAASELPQKLEEKWSVETEYGWTATAAVQGGRVYAGSLTGFVHCFDLKTGEELWKRRTIESDDEDDFAPGFKAAPLLTETLVVIGDEEGIVHALDRKTGKVAWKFETGAEIAGCPARYKDRILFASHDAFLYCVKADSGEVVWKFETEDRINGSIAIVDHFTFVAGCDNHMRVIDIENGTQVRDTDLGSFLIASPAIYGNMLYVGTQDAELIAIDWTTGKVVWRYRCPKEFPIHASCAVTEKYVVFGGHDKHLRCLNRADGRELWSLGTRAQINSSPVIVGQRVFFGSDDGNLYEASLTDGTQLGKYRLGGAIPASPAVADRHLVIGVGRDDGKLFAFGP